ncbi:uncharacterized protein [Spinacia oleracea]|uniref:Retrotransposon gag domain-containing protein n=1 Tax=Spinacia oleracea TaxID=3562 RepID=A0ABM3RIK0_SPIOL|nr:uncharacterized protein LOC110781238 [Spinacia oleracea]
MSKSLKSYGVPSSSSVPTGLTMPTIEAINFEIKPALIYMAFLEELFPPTKTAEIRHKLTTFTQEPGESLRKAWDRFKASQRSCPHHNIRKWFLVQIFYHVLQDDTKNTVDSADGGVFLDKEVDAGCDSLANLAANHYSTTITTSKRGKMDVDAYTLLSSQVDALNLKIDSLKDAQSGTPPMSINAMSSLAPATTSYCEPHVFRPPFPQGASHNAPPGFNRPPHQGYQQQPPQINANLEPNIGDLYKLVENMQKTSEIAQKNHDESIKELKNQNRMLENQVAQLADTLSKRQPGKLLGQSTSSQDHTTESACAIVLRSGTTYDAPSVPIDFADLGKGREEARRKKDRFNEKVIDDSCPFVPRLPFPHRQHKSMGDYTSGEEAYVESKTVDVGVETPSVENEMETKESSKEKVTDFPPFAPTLPFPHRMQKTKVDQQFGKFLAMFKNFEVKIPFTDLISQIPMYAKYLKELITKKRNLGGVERVALTEECSAMLQNKSSPKLKDPGSFSIPCHVGALFIDKALCDLGASVSVIPLSIYKKLNMGEMKCTTITLQMADHSIKYPLGVLEDVPVRVGKFYIPVDFVVLDIAEDNQIPIILGRPFLHTAGAFIDVNKGKLTLTVGDDKVTFSLYHVMESSMQEVSCSLIASNAKLPHSYSRNSSNNALGLKGLASDDDPGDAVDASSKVGIRGSVLDGTGFGAPDW